MPDVAMRKELRDLRRRLRAIRPDPEADPECPECRDTGWVDTDAGMARCRCWREGRAERLMEVAGIPSKYSDCTVRGFLLYPDADPSLAAARDECVGYLEEFSRGSRGLLIQGPPGVGKTHLAAAVLRAIIRHHQVRGLFLDYGIMLKRIQDGFDRRSGEDRDRVLDNAICVPVLLLDELGRRRPTPWAEDVLTDLLNERYAAGRTTIVTTNYGEEPTDEFDALDQRIGPRLRSRLHEMCHLVPMQGEDFRVVAQRGDYR